MRLKNIIVFILVFSLFSINSWAQYRLDVYYFAPNAILLQTNDTLRLCQTEHSFKAFFIETATNDTLNADATFRWYFKSPTPLNGDSIAHTFDEGGALMLQLTATKEAISQTIYIPLEVSIKPNFTESTISTNQTICLGDQVELTGKITFNPFELKQDSIKDIDDTEIALAGQTVFDFWVAGFPNNLTFTPDLLDSVMIHLEHESSSDLSIALACPDGKQMLLKANNEPTCYMGEPVDSQTDNTPGKGYWYYWSPTNVLETMAAEAGQHKHSYTDVSGNNYTDVHYLPQGTYQPSQDFSTLTGCPVNGNWKMIITDAYSNNKTGTVFAYGLDFDHQKLTDWTFAHTYNAIPGGLWSGDGIGNLGTNGTATGRPTDYGWAQYTYTVKDNFGCLSDTMLAVRVAKPTFDATPAGGEAPVETNFTNTTEWGNAFEWDFLPDEGIESTIENPNYTYQDKGTYSILLYATSVQGCKDVSDTLTIEITIPPSEIKEIPNAFSPNNDGLNDLFVVETIQLATARMVIFTRSGSKIIELSELNDDKFFWDGTPNNNEGVAVAQGTYFYHIEAVGKDGVKHKRRGYFNVFYGK